MDSAVTEHEVPQSRSSISHGSLIVSVESNRFTSAFLTSSVQSLSRWHESFSVIIADDLMTYNKLHMKSSPVEFERLLQQYRYDRTKHLSRLRESLGLSPDRMHIGLYGDICDKGFSRAMRRFYMIVMTDQELLDVFDEKASRFTAVSMIRDHEAWTPEQRHRSSMAYLIEETIWTIYLYATQDVTDVYYPGDFGRLINRVYSHPDYQTILAFLGLPKHSSRFWNLFSEPDGAIERKLAWQHLESF